jgi:outer membrane receptor protein involved in Fe transport
VDTGLWFHRAQLLWEHAFDRGASLRVLAAVGRDVNDVQFARVASLRVDRVPLLARVEYARPLARTVRWNLGLDLAAGPAAFTFRGPRPPGLGSGVVTSTADLEPVATDAAGFLARTALWTDLELTPSPRVRLLPSLRVDHFADIRAVTVAPRFAFRVRPAERWTLKGGLGLFFQPPQFQQTLDAPNRASTTGQRVGNPDLGPARAVHYSLGFERELTAALTLSAEGFVRTVDGLVAQTGDPAAPIPYANAAASRAFGGEFLLRYRPTGRLFGWVAYTLSRTLIRPRPDAPFDLTDFDQTHILTAVASLDLGRGWTLGARFRYVTGTPDAVLQGAVFNADTLVYVPAYEPTASRRIDDFHQLDLRVDKTWSFSRGSLTLFLDLWNVYNRANPEGPADSFDYRQRGVTTGLPIVPSLGLKGEL